MDFTGCRRKAAGSVVSLYGLMNSAYGAPEIREFSAKLNHVAIIDYNKRRGEAKEFEPARKLRYNERSAAERMNLNLKDNYSGGNVWEYMANVSHQFIPGLW